MSNYPGWFKPEISFILEGRAWIGNGHFVFAATAQAAEGTRTPDSAAESMAKVIASASDEISPRTDTTRGYAIFGERAFQAHYVDLCEAVHPGITWSQCPDVHTKSGAMIGSVVGVPVAVVIGLVGGSADLPDRDAAPTCPVCEGDKRSGDCGKCSGLGARECDMGHEHNCDACNGMGRVGRCVACGGDGIWKEARS